MEWKKINFDELGYFCKSTRAEAFLECDPLCLQLEELLGIFLYYDVRYFQIKDIQKLYSVLNLRRMRSDGILAPQPKKIQTILERLSLQDKVSIKPDGYAVTDNNKVYHDYYSEIIEKGYKKDFIKDWIAYNQKMSLIKIENIPQ